MKHLFTHSGDIKRRRFLTNGALMLAIPLSAHASNDGQTNNPPRRLLAISNNLGFLPRYFFPDNSGVEYARSRYLSELTAWKSHFTVFSGLSHPACEGGHSTENCFLTSAKHPASSGFRNSISLDQYIAEHASQETRFASINLGINIDKAHRSLSWTRDGVLIPAEDSPVKLFQKMFLVGSKAEVRQAMSRLQRQKSILDDMRESRNSQTRTLGRRDRQRLEQYLQTIRELEQRLQVAQRWVNTPKPTPTTPAPKDITDRSRFIEKFDQMLTMARLAFETDATRVITLMVDAFATPQFHLPDDTLAETDYHNLSHHGQRDSHLTDLENVDTQQMKLFNRLLSSLANTMTRETTLLDETMVLLGSNMGNANTHTNTNLPILLAGGGLRHQGHLAFNTENNTPLANLFVTILQLFGLPTSAFGSSNSRIDLG